MKRSLFFLPVLAAGLIFSSCEDAEVQNAYIRVNIDGTLWEADQDIVCLLAQGNTAEVSGEQTSAEDALTFQVYNVLDTGTFQFTGDIGNLMYQAGGVEYFIDSTHGNGSVTLQDVQLVPSGGSAEIYGTFSGVAYNDAGTDSVVLTNGKFGYE